VLRRAELPTLRTAALFTVVPERQAVPLPQDVSFDTGACLGIPALTAHRAVHAGGPVAGCDVLVQGGAGGVGSFACGLARRAGARVIATVRSAADESAARQAGAHAVVRIGAPSRADIVADLRRLAPEGVHHIVEVAFDANIELDEQVLAPVARLPPTPRAVGSRRSRSGSSSSRTRDSCSWAATTSPWNTSLQPRAR
jgi:NADPH2:quinone reductase